MAQKSVKKPTAKAAATKKTTVKKTTVKKSAAAKQPVMESPVLMPTPETHECMCGAGCKCHHGCTFGRFIKKLIIVLVIFALGFAAAKMCCCKHPGMHAPRVHFVNGCVDVASIKCPKLAAEIPNMDINGDGCVSRDEFRAVKKEMRREISEITVTEVEE